MQVVYRSKILLQKKAKERKNKNKIFLENLVGKIKQKYPMLYAEVGSKNVKQILKVVFKNYESD